MAYLDQFTIPVKGLQAGRHEYQYSVDNQFFNVFGSDLIKEGSFRVDVILTKNADMIDVEVTYSGYWSTGCDRCLADIDLPLNDGNRYLIKYADKESDEGDILYISRDSNEMNIAKLIFESICISLPVRKIYECENELPRPCDLKVLEKLGLLEETVADGESDNIWFSLSDLQLGTEEE